MSTDQRVPDYELDDVRVVASPQAIKAMFDPLRGTLLELLLERAASVQELAAAVERPKSSVAYHVGLLAAADLLRVVRTRRVRGIDERYYGRTARIFYVGGAMPEQSELPPGPFEDIAAESAPAQREDNLRAIRRYARISDADADAFWYRVFVLVNEYAQLPRTEEGDNAYAFVAALYPTRHPTLPPRLSGQDEESTEQT